MKRLTVFKRLDRGCPLIEKKAIMIINVYVRKPRWDIGIENISEYFDELTLSQFTLSEILQKLSNEGSPITFRCRWVSSAAITTPEGQSR
jgi:hypothetical protein